MHHPTPLLHSHQAEPKNIKAREITPLQLESQDLQAAAAAGIVTPAQADGLWTFLRERTQNLFGEQPRFSAAHILYHLCGIGVGMYLGHLAYVLFKDSLLFPFTLTFIGLALIGADKTMKVKGLAIENSPQFLA